MPRTTFIVRQSYGVQEATSILKAINKLRVDNGYEPVDEDSDELDELNVTRVYHAK